MTEKKTYLTLPNVAIACSLAGMILGGIITGAVQYGLLIYRVDDHIDDFRGHDQKFERYVSHQEEFNKAALRLQIAMELQGKLDKLSVELKGVK